MHNLCLIMTVGGLYNKVAKKRITVKTVIISYQARELPPLDKMSFSPAALLLCKRRCSVTGVRLRKKGGSPRLSAANKKDAVRGHLF